MFQVLILVDPPVKKCRQVGAKPRDFKNKPYQYGYVDFTLWSDALGAYAAKQPGPFRECAYDDVYYYLSQWVLDHQTLTPNVAALIVKRLMLSHTMSLIEFLKSLLSNLEDRLRRTPAGIEHFHWVEGTLTELFGWNRRLSEYCEHTEAALDGLRILPEGCTAEKERWGSCSEDFRYVHRRMLNLKNRINELITNANGLIGLVEAKRSLDVAIAAKTLTIIGLLFLPLGFMSGLFSLGQNYGPGESRFWVYWVVTIPFLGLVFVVYLVVGRFQKEFKNGKWKDRRSSPYGDVANAAISV